jgi:hypothetical protein
MQSNETVMDDHNPRFKGRRISGARPVSIEHSDNVESKMRKLSITDISASIFVGLTVFADARMINRPVRASTA